MVKNAYVCHVYMGIITSYTRIHSLSLFPSKHMTVYVS